MQELIALLLEYGAGLVPKRVHATGISNGASFCHFLAAHLSPRLAAIAPVAGGMPEALAARFAPRRPVSVLIINGTADPLVPYQGGEVRPPGSEPRGRIVGPPVGPAQRLRAHPAVERPRGLDTTDGCSVSTLRYANGADGTKVVLRRMEGAGHTWSGGQQYLPRRVIGSVCRDADGGELVWRFFDAHPKP